VNQGADQALVGDPLFGGFDLNGLQIMLSGVKAQTWIF